MKRVLLPVVKVAITAALLYAVGKTIDWNEVGITAFNVHPVYLGFALSLVAVQCLMLGWRWHRIVGFLGGQVPAPQACSWTLVGIFFNQALPSSVGGDAVRIWMLHRHGTAEGVALSSVFVDRISGLVVIGLLVSLAAALLSPQAGLGLSMVVLMLAGPVLLMGLFLVLLVGHRLRPRLPLALATPLGRVLQAFSILARHRGALIETVALGALAALTGLAAAWVLGLGMGLEAGPAAYVAFVGGAVLLAVAPISVGGWGLREAGVVALFANIDAPRETVLAMSLLWGLTPIAIAAPWTAWWWLRKGRAGRPAPQ